ncbi:MAG: metallophosphoesterase [Chitinophagaceae bacterium]|nr:metallophosphoesterase [Chitinophagaceae bacterium]
MEQDVQQLAAELKQRLEADASILGDFQALLQYLPDCEYELISFMVAQNVWKGFIPPPPTGYKKGDGTVDLGLILYWLNNPLLIDQSMFSPHEKLLFDALIIILDLSLPSSQMTTVNADFFKTNELIYTDGSVLSTKQWATYDQGWLVAVLNLLQSTIYDLWYWGPTLPTTPPPVIQLNKISTGTVKLAVIGDCGTGDYTLQRIMQSIYKEKPDYILHVGDVYYAGTPTANGPHGDKFFFPGEETSNLNFFWPPDYKGRSFTLNSNHEMYSGAIGYFNDALDAANGGVNSLFSAQKGSSYFVLKMGDWVLLGLDSAYQASTTDAFMTGSIGSPTDVQTKFLQQYRPNPAKTILFTHHNGFEPDLSAVSPLWAEIRNALGGDPYAWYWGHVHNGLVYKSPVAIPYAAPSFTTKTYARCLGHAALPYGPIKPPPYGQIVWQEPNLKPNGKELYNGWAMLTFTLNNGNVTNIREDFYDLSRVPPVFSNYIYSTREE